MSKPWEKYQAPSSGPWEKYGQGEQPAVVKVGAAINEIPRQIGLTARYGLEGLANTAQIFTEPIRHLQDKITGVPSLPLGQIATSAADWRMPRPGKEPCRARRARRIWSTWNSLKRR